MLLIPVVTAALILFSPVFSVAQDWVEYSNQADFFSVNLPGQPRVRDIIYKTLYNITVPGRVYTAEDGPSRYSVTVVDYTDAKRKHEELVKTCRATGGDGDQCNERSALDARSAIVLATWQLIERNPKVTHLVYTQADLVEGHEIHLENAQGNPVFAMIYMHEDRLYILEGTVPKDTPPPVLFQQSMRFLDRDGKSIRYSSTYTNGFPAPKRAR
jgi:hypothetical protein